MNFWDKCRYDVIRTVLTKTEGNLSHAAKMVDWSNPTFRKHARELGLWPWKGENGHKKIVR